MSADASSPSPLATRPASTPRTRGVYILGNDVVLEYAIALFRSLRHHSPDIPVRLLPYDGRLEKLRPWMQRYNIQLHDDPDYPFYDRLGNELWDHVHLGHHMFRKFAAFSGPFDDFLYLDIDIAVLAPLENLFDPFDRSAAQFLSFDNDIDNVYRRGPLRDRLVAEGKTKGFNAGAFMSRRAAFANSELPALIAHAKSVRAEFHDPFDQTFFNFAVDIKGLHQVRITEFDPAYPDKQWGDQVPFLRRDHAWRLCIPGHPDFGKAQPFIHWAGHDAGDALPNRHIFYHYRLMGESSYRRLAYKLADRWRWWFARPCARSLAWIKQTSDRLRIKAGRWRRRSSSTS